MSNFVLGFDSSTQSFTALLINADSMQITAEMSVNFDEALPQYETKSGTLVREDPSIVHAPPLMWAEALDLIMSKMQVAQWPLNKVRCIAGSAQQHGTVYLNDQAAVRLATLEQHQSLQQQLNGIFSRSTSPIWLDSSTHLDCLALEDALGGPQSTWNITGSLACERFSGPQIRRFARTQPDGYDKTKHIVMVSSFLASILAGKIVPTDVGDASGMNLMDLKTKKWDLKVLEACAPNLAQRLGEPVSSSSLIGELAPYFKKYGFSTGVQILPWSGDNPSSQVGLGLIQEGDCALSLGTSDVIFSTMKNVPQFSGAEGHVFVTPTGDYMSLLCFANGSLAREKIRDAYQMNWASFDAAIANTTPGNNGALMLPWFVPEITPKVLRSNVVRHELDEQDASKNCRAIIESQMLSRRLHLKSLGIIPKTLKVTGGASKNRQIVQIIADVFQCPIEEIQVSASAALGAGIRALQMITGKCIEDCVTPFVHIHHRTEPNIQLKSVYDTALKTMAQLEKQHLSSN